MVITVIYLVMFLAAIGDFSFHGGSSTLRWAERPLGLLFRRRGPFYFEAIALLRLPFATYLFSPLNLLLGLTVAILVGLNGALAYLAVAQPRVCRARGHTGLLAGLPALLAGSACCGPLLFIVLGVQVSAALVGLFSYLIPLGIGLLTVTLVINARRTERSSTMVSGEPSSVRPHQVRGDTPRSSP